MARLPVPESDAAVIPAAEHDVVLVDGQRVDDAVVTLEVHHEVAARVQPLLDLARARRRPRVLGRVVDEGAHAALVVRQHAHRLAGREVVHADCGVQAAGDDLGVGGLGQDGADGAAVAAEHVDVAARAHVPDAHDAVAPARAQDVEGRVQAQRVHARQVPVVVPDHLVRLEVPALDHLVLAAAEEVGVARADGEAAHGGDVAGQGQLERAGRQVPDLDGPIASAGGEPLVARFHRQRAHPAEMAGDDPEELPRRVPFRLLLPHRVSPDQTRRVVLSLGCRAMRVRGQFGTRRAIQSRQGHRAACRLLRRWLP